MKLRKQRRRQQGFTLMEVLLVLTILVVLGSLVSVSYITIQRNSKVSTAKIQINQLEEALNFYQQDVGRFPSDLNGLYQPPADLSNPKKWKGPYLTEQITSDPWDGQYQYESKMSEFNLPMAVITSFGPDGQSGTEDDISNVNNSG